jgi:transposase
MATPDSLEPLAEYLEPRFGDIYESDAGAFTRAWSDELRQAVRHYIAEAVADELYRHAILHLFEWNWDLEAPRAQVAESIVAHEQPWEIAYAFHVAAAILQPTLESLVTRLDSWGTGEDRDACLDAVHWLANNATAVQLHDMFRLTPGPLPEYIWDRDPDQLDVVDLCQAHRPGRLLQIWEMASATAPAPSDLSDAEWQLLAPLVPRHPGWHDERLHAITRNSIDGFLYRHATGTAWSRVPLRYRPGQKPDNLGLKFYFWRRNQVFVRMREALQGNPDAARLVAWLKTVDD